MKFIKHLVLIALGIAIGVAGCYYLYYTTFLQNKTADAQILLKNIKNVTKMITVEAEYENIVAHKDFIKYDFYPFRKKAILKVNAKVAAGCDLEKLNFKIDEANKTLTIYSVPEAEILSVDTDVEYYNMQEGFFNSFSEKELTELNAKAKEQIKTEAYTSDLMAQADARAMEMLDIISVIAKSAGFEVVIQVNRKN